MDPKKRIDKILDSVHAQVQEEVGTLLGVELSVSDTRAELVTKEAFFEDLLGKQILAKIDISGDVEGVGCLVIGIKDAIRLGGTLIMLPDSELEEVVGREEYTEETEDSYGEIANIIAGSYTKVFEETYPKACRFIRKEQEVVAPVKVDIESDEPVPDQPYYQVRCTMSMGNQQMGDLHMLMPAATFGLVEEKEEDSEQVAGANGSMPQPEPVEEENVTVSSDDFAEGVAPEQAPQKKTIDPVKHKKRVDRVLGSCEEKLSEELSSLLGVEIKCSGQQNTFISKEEFFYEEVEGKQVIADMEVTGEQQGKSYFAIGMKDSIHLGGVLIMLPPSELEVVIADEEFSEDLKDSYGEVANIVAGVYTSIFEEQYSEKLRFIKKELHEVLPLKVDVDADEPCPDQQYYMSSMSLHVDGTDLGKIRMLIPAVMLRIATDEAEEEVPETAEVAADAVNGETTHEELPVEGAVPQEAPKGPEFDFAKHKKRVDQLLKECVTSMQEEVSALLASDIKLKNLDNRLISKEDFFFDVANGKQVMANLDVVGELEDKSYLFVTLKDAIHMGGVLIMLPPSELESAVSEEEFNEDCSDAYGEIANIIAGVYTGVFEEQYTKKIRFVRTDLEQVIPMKVDIDSDNPIPDREYYMSSMSLVIGDQELGNVNLMFPADMLQLDGASQKAAEEAAAAQVSQSQAAISAAKPAGVEPVRAATPAEHVPVDILVISDNEMAAEELAKGAGQRGYSVRKITFQDDVRAAITNEVKAVYIVMRAVDEQAFSMIIKVNSSCSLPLIAAGPQWTRTKVIKAVRYGVNDILLTPASDEDIAENLDNNLVSMAA